MSRAKIILGGIIVVGLLAILFVVGAKPQLPQAPAGISGETSALNAGSGDTSISGSAFTDASGGSLAGGEEAVTLDDVARIIERTVASTTYSFSSQSGTRSVAPLSFPDVPDRELAIDAAGASTVSEYIDYFNVHASEISFEVSKFDNVLKDENKIPLFTQSLIDRAIADNNFAEIKASLLVQKDFAAAITAYLKQIKVKGSSTIALDKKAIGAEALVAQLIDKALAVGAGTMPQKDFLAYYDRFSLTLANARQELIVKSGAFSTAPADDWVSWLRAEFSPVAHAQIGLSPFGGRVLLILPCPCSFGSLVTIGTPKPANLFVSYAFLASPLFYNYKTFSIGVWWLGLKNPAAVPCLIPALPVCVVIGYGNVIYDTGTSRIP